ncbi:uncharacterized protein Dwil_GK26979 [Drosophila willistoni]|uniref:Senescence domain-containing protein n=1 Tax=Drosophila willistoni TaxID=7260 RepID=A0A0Q9WUP0_DROWI|nr:protein spartin-like [Drosophila willistoni]KRF99866.1 uncharacterized protein Dwil_GK26979 [Drosophila willistoni]
MDVSQSSDLSLPKEQTHKSPKQVAKDLQDLFASTESRAQLVKVFQAQIKLYCIGSNEVTSTAENLKMSMMKCTLGGKWNYLSGTFFMCAMENDTDIIWLYPVIPNSTKFYCTDFGALIFPDLESEASDNAFGIIIVGPTIADQAQEEEKRDDSAGIDYQNLTMDGAEDIASTLVKGAEKADSLLTKCTSYITSKMDPPKAPTQVPPSVRATVEVAQNVTYAAADLTERIAEKVGSASQEMGRVLAIHLQKQGSILVKKAATATKRITKWKEPLLQPRMLWRVYP